MFTSRLQNEVPDQELGKIQFKVPGSPSNRNFLTGHIIKRFSCPVGEFPLDGEPGTFNLTEFQKHPNYPIFIFVINFQSDNLYSFSNF